MIRRLCLFASMTLCAAAAPAENSKPQPVAFVDTIPAARDVPYPGTITLDIDATDTRRGIFSVKERIPVPEGGHIVLLFPKWLPGNHSDTGQIEKLAGVKMSSGGKRIAWSRDPVDVYAFHVDLPRGARSVDVELQFLSATVPAQGRVVMTPDALRLQWQSMSLYPAGYFVRQIPVEATVRYPDGFTAASALPSKVVAGVYRYAKTDYETLVDSPVLAGRYFKSFALTPDVALDVVADTPEQLAATPAQIDAHRRLVDQSLKLFGARHYDDYHFLLAISDRLGGIGLEHHRSSENGVGPGYFIDWDNSVGARDLLPHEFSHSWNGKYRRPADLWTPDYRVPMRGSLLWLYEGQTTFWQNVLAARSGMQTKQEALDAIAATLATVDATRGRDWRSLADTTTDPVIAYSAPKAWINWQRGKDYYPEGAAVWLEIDAQLRRQTGGAKSLDDFARAFFGERDGDWGVVTYDFDDVVATLDRIAPGTDWRRLLTQRLTETGAAAPLAGLTDSGYRLTYGDVPTGFTKAAEKERKRTDLSYSIGLVIGRDGEIGGVAWDSAAFKAGLVVGSTIVAVNGVTYSGDALKAAIVAAKTDGRAATAPIVLTVRQGDRIEERRIDYHQGLRYPQLVKIGSGDGGLDRLLAPR